MNGFYEKLGKVLGYVVAYIITTLYSGLVLSKVWLWFIVPTFGMAPLRIIECIGIFIVALLFKGMPDQKNVDKGMLFTFAYAITANTMILCVGSICQLFV